MQIPYSLCMDRTLAARIEALGSTVGLSRAAVMRRLLVIGLDHVGDDALALFQPNRARAEERA